MTNHSEYAIDQIVKHSGAAAVVTAITAGNRHDPNPRYTIRHLDTDAVHTSIPGRILEPIACDRCGEARPCQYTWHEDEQG